MIYTSRYVYNITYMELVDDETSVRYGGIILTDFYFQIVTV